MLSTFMPENPRALSPSIANSLLATWLSFSSFRLQKFVRRVSCNGKGKSDARSSKSTGIRFCLVMLYPEGWSEIICRIGTLEHINNIAFLRDSKPFVHGFHDIKCYLKGHQCSS